jgi:tetratricopeptide (TPR) repeat protein
MCRSVVQSDAPGIVSRRGQIRRFLFYSVVASALANSPLLSRAQTPNGEIARLERDAESDLRAQKPELAIIAYRKILALDPANVGAHSNLGLAYYVHGDFAPAATEFNIALRGQADQWNIVALSGISEANIGQNANAVAHLDLAFQHVEDRELRLAVGKRLFSLLFEKGDLRRAAETVARLEQMEPNSVDVLYAAHQVYSLLDSKIFVTMAQLAPDSARMYQLRGDRMAHMGKMKAAIDAYRRAIDHDPHLAGVHFELAEILSISEDSSERGQAEGEYLKELANYPQDEKSECRLGDIELQRSDVQRAIGHYLRALELQPDDPDANEGYGMALLASELPLKACTYLKRAIELDPTNITAHYHLSLASRKVGDIETAKREMDEFLRRKAEREHLTHTFDDLPIQAVRETSRQSN